MANHVVAYDEWEVDFAVDYREHDASQSERSFLAGCERTPQERFANQARFRRQSGQGASGIHQRGRRRRDA